MGGILCSVLNRLTFCSKFDQEHGEVCSKGLPKIQTIKDQRQNGRFNKPEVSIVVLRQHWQGILRQIGPTIATAMTIF